jgi:hypothetical protein
MAVAFVGENMASSRQKASNLNRPLLTPSWRHTRYHDDDEFERNEVEM